MSNHQIKFELSEEGVLPFNIGKIGMADVLSIGALKYTKKSSYDPKTLVSQYKTDDAGLKQIIHSGEQVVETINDIVNVLGLLLVGDFDAINKSDITKIGWALVGLSELSQAIEEEMQDLHYAELCNAKSGVNEQE